MKNEYPWSGSKVNASETAAWIKENIEPYKPSLTGKMGCAERDAIVRTETPEEMPFEEDEEYWDEE